MKCNKCNEESELKVFSTFQYHYCSSCKEEITKGPDIVTPQEWFIRYFMDIDASIFAVSSFKKLP